jgi:hypothetical protein
MRKRKAHISMREKLASALAHLMVEVDGKLERAIPYDDAKRMTAEELCSLYHFDHGIPEAIDGETRHWNLTPRFIAEHRRKTANQDIPAIHKTDRLAEGHEAFRRRVLAKSGQDLGTGVEKPAAKPRSMLRSRGFQKAPPGHKWFKRKGTPA